MNVNMREIFSRQVTPDDTKKVVREFNSALDTATKRDGGKVANLAMQVWDAFSSPEIGSQTKIVATIALLYFILPFDLIPDMTPVFGYADDVLVLAFAIQNIAAYGSTARTCREIFRKEYGVDS